MAGSAAIDGATARAPSESGWTSARPGRRPRPRTRRRHCRGGALARGIAVIRAALRTLPAGPGVYRMLNAKGDALYVGKARNLKSRVANYTHLAKLSNRLRRMVAETRALEVVVTHTEVEALLLECNLIKRLMPRYNVLLRDDKSFPYIHLTGDHAFPQLTKHRGARGDSGDYFGPFASAGAVNRTLIALQRAFLLRSCSDSVFATRTRPCLLYQIKRCSAPCVGRIDKAGYAELVDEARGFLAGHSQEVQEQLARRMQELSEALDFESAALLRDRIRALTQVQGRQDINVESLGDADVIAAHQAGGQTCDPGVLLPRRPELGQPRLFPEPRPAARPGGGARRLHRPVLRQQAAAARGADRATCRPTRRCSPRRCRSAPAARSSWSMPQRGDKRKLVEHALDQCARGAGAQAGRKLDPAQAARRRRRGVRPRRAAAAHRGLRQQPHPGHATPVGAMIVAGPDGFMKNAYRKFNIRGGDARPDARRGEAGEARRRSRRRSTRDRRAPA